MTLATFKMYAEPKDSGITEITVFYRENIDSEKRRIDAEFDGSTSEVKVLSDRRATDAIYGEGS